MNTNSMYVTIAQSSATGVSERVCEVADPKTVADGSSVSRTRHERLILLPTSDLYYPDFVTWHFPDAGIGVFTAEIQSDGSVLRRDRKTRIVQVSEEWDEGTESAADIQRPLSANINGPHLKCDSSDMLSIFSRQTKTHSDFVFKL